MAAPTKVYSRKIWANVTAEQLATIRREIALNGGNISVVVRGALDAYFAEPVTPTKKPRTS